MSPDEPHGLFDEAHAPRYDRDFEKLAPIRNALLILARCALRHLPDRAHILSVGVGTGEELLYLAGEFPQWRFTALDTSPPMLAACREKIEAAGYSQRVTYHEGPVLSLGLESKFDAATALFVSQFLAELDVRRNFFEEIRKRLIAPGVLVCADVTATPDERLLELYRGVLALSEMAPEKGEEFLGSLRTSPAEVAALIESAGFQEQTQIYQAGLIHAWLARRT